MKIYYSSSSAPSLSGLSKQEAKARVREIVPFWLSGINTLIAFVGGFCIGVFGSKLFPEVESLLFQLSLLIIGTLAVCIVIINFLTVPYIEKHEPSNVP